MNILITGATGLIGRHLTQRLLSLSHTLTVLSRDPTHARQLLGDKNYYLSSLTALSSLDRFDAVINLAGEPIMAKRWSADQKQLLCQSRWILTEQLSELISASSTPPSVFISGSAMGYYGDQEHAVVTESEEANNGFTHYLCAHWESLAQDAASDKTRVCLCRTGIVLSPEGGALAKMLPLFRLGLGGPLGGGKQYMPWIHIDDMVNALLYLLDTPSLSGPFNMVSPYPVNNETFTNTLAEILHRPALLPMPGPLLRLLLGEASTLLLEGQRGLPQRLEQAGFGFRFFDLADALTDLLVKQ